MVQKIREDRHADIVVHLFYSELQFKHHTQNRKQHEKQKIRLNYPLVVHWWLIESQAIEKRIDYSENSVENDTSDYGYDCCSEVTWYILAEEDWMKEGI